jgi:hypothetical protein
VFNLAIENRTPYAVGETYFPVIGGIQGLGTNHGQLKATRFVHLDANKSPIKADIFHTFRNYSFGGDAPEQFFGYRQEMGSQFGGRKTMPTTLAEPWIAFMAPSLNRSVYLGARDSIDRPLIAQMRLLPSGASLREDGNWPRPDELRGLPVGVEFNFVDCNGGKPGENYQAVPVVIRFHDGDWEKARKIKNGSKSGIR